MSEQHWYSMPTEVLLERSWALSNPLDCEAGRCIRALAWRLRGAEEWIESLSRRGQTQEIPEGGTQA